MKNLYLFQPQQTFEFAGRKSYWLPYSVGCLWSYAVQNPQIADNYNLVDIYFKRSNIKKILDEMKNPDVVAFSCYIWNWEYSRKLASAIKEKWPKCYIVFGGPQVTNKPLENSFFKKHPYVDSIINGEGEIAFTNLLVDIANNVKPKKIIPPSRLTDLNYPSPYLSGVFDKILKDNPNIGWQTVMETNRGCPYACTFCDWGSLTYSKVLKFNEERISQEIEWFSKNKIEYLYIADANFGVFYDRDKKFAQHLSNLQITTGFPSLIVTNWAKNAKEKIIDIAKIFFNNNKNRGFTISVQSMNDVVLDAINRKNMDINDLSAMLKICNREGIPAYTELILGLPYETKETWKENFDKLLEAGQHNQLEVWFCQLLENSAINSFESRTLHQIETVPIPNLLAGTNLADDSAIVEYENIVKSTRYMSYEDLLDSYMFSHIILNYHYGGWTQILSRFLHKHTGLSYLNFYSKLEEYIKTSDGILSEQYKKIYKFAKLNLDNATKEEDVKKFQDSDLHLHGGAWLGLKVFGLNRNKVFDEIFSLFSKEFCGLDDLVYENLKKFQINAMYEFTENYPYQTVFDYNIYSYVFEDAELVSTPQEINFTYPFKWESLNDFKDRIFVFRKSGALKSRYEVVRNE